MPGTGAAVFGEVPLSGLLGDGVVCGVDGEVCVCGVDGDVWVCGVEGALWVCGLSPAALVVIGVGGPIVLEGVDPVDGAADGAAARCATAQLAQPSKRKSVVNRMFITILPDTAADAAS
ncbi:MAG TPA: hypothetical protein VGG04_06615 [Candidatus Sulfotelmatobacter sp.]